MSKLIELWNLAGAALIVPSKTGINVTNQVGGSACLHPMLEGFVIPISNDVLLEDFSNSLEWQLCHLFDGAWGVLSDLKLKQIQAVLAKYPETRSITIDWARKADSYESWVWVISEETSDSVHKGLGTINGVLTWQNSD